MGKKNKENILEKLVTPVDLLDKMIEECSSTIQGLQSSLDLKQRELELLQQLKENLYAPAPAPKKVVKVVVKRKTE